MRKSGLSAILASSVLVSATLLLACKKHRTEVFSAPENFEVFHNSGEQRPAFNGDFLPDGYGVSVGERIRVTNDWGRVWQEVDVPVWNEYSALVLRNDHTFYFGSTEFYVADKTGCTFTQLATQTMIDLQMTGHSTLIAASPDMVKSSDGGVTWEVTYAHNGVSYFQQIDMVDSLIGFARGGNTSNNQSTGEIILKTNDGGNSWAPVYETSAMHIESIEFVNPLEGYLINSQAELYKTSDGGRHWSQKADLSAILTGFLGGQALFITAREGYVWSKFGNQLFVTHDGGQNWKLVFTASENEGIARVKYMHGKVMILGVRGLVAWSE